MDCWECVKQRGRNNGRIQGKYAFRYVLDSLKDELLGEDGILPLPRVRLSHLDAVQVDVTVGVGEILHRQLMGLLYIQHQAAHLRGNKGFSPHKTYIWIDLPKKC